MKLGTFGAILSFALQMEQRTASFYQTVAQDYPGELFTDLARRAQPLMIGQCRTLDHVPPGLDASGCSVDVLSARTAAARGPRGGLADAPDGRGRVQSHGTAR